MRILFMGTPDIAADCLKALYEAGHDICAVYTRRDKPVGRKQVLTAPPVKEVALAHGTPVFQPRTLRDGGEDENIRALAPELIVVVAYGCILPKSVLEAPKYGCINLHVSLLPKYRGSAPVQWAVQERPDLHRPEQRLRLSGPDPVGRGQAGCLQRGKRPAVRACLHDRPYLLLEQDHLRQGRHLLPHHSGRADGCRQDLPGEAGR